MSFLYNWFSFGKTKNKSKHKHAVRDEDEGRIITPREKRKNDLRYDLETRIGLRLSSKEALDYQLQIYTQKFGADDFAKNYGKKLETYVQIESTFSYRRDSGLNKR